MNYYHCRNLESVSYGIVEPDPSFSDPDFLSAYRWLEKKIGFFPLFLSVNGIIDTGYLQKEDKNLVLFKFTNVERSNVSSFKGVFYDCDVWEEVLNRILNGYKVSKNVENRLWKGKTELVVPFLDLSKSEKIWTKNNENKTTLEKLGFSNVIVD